MREVIYSEYEKKEGETYHTLIVKGRAKFHGWGVDYAELENGAGNFSTAIIELPDGSVKNVQVEHVKFLDEGE